MDNLSKETQQKIGQLQLIEQNIQNILIQKQQLQLQLSEIESALKEIENLSKGYKIIGSIMVESEKKDIQEDLNKKREMVVLRIKNFEKQEGKISAKAKKLQEEVLSEVNKK